MSITLEELQHSLFWRRLAGMHVEFQMLEIQLQTLGNGPSCRRIASHCLRTLHRRLDALEQQMLQWSHSEADMRVAISELRSKLVHCS